MPEQPIESTDAQLAYVQANPLPFLQEMERLQNQIAKLEQEAQARQASTIVTPPSTSSPSSSLSPEFLTSIVAAVTAAMSKNLSTDKPAKSEKLPDIAEYDGNMDNLDSWEQSLIQRMHVNHDRYPTENEKITYAESRLTIGKKAHNLMNRYRKDSLCALTSLKDWRMKLRQACGNRFEEEDARTYLRDTLKQGTLSFEEYYNLFTQKKERSGMEDASLIDAMRSNVNYATQAAAISWRKTDGSRPVTFDDHVQMWSDTDWDLRQLKHRHSRTTPAANASNSPTTRRGNAPATTSTSNTTTRITPAVTTPAAPVAAAGGDPMDLSSAMAAVRGHKLTDPGVRKICDDWKLCFYCRRQHPGTIGDCPNRKTTAVRSLVLYEGSSNAQSTPISTSQISKVQEVEKA